VAFLFHGFDAREWRYTHCPPPEPSPHVAGGIWINADLQKEVAILPLCFGSDSIDFYQSEK
jgi:hypothetical protein